MSRDFILIFSGGMVSLITTLVVLFVADYIYRREQIKQAEPKSAPPIQVSKPEAARPVEIKPAPPIQVSKSEAARPVEIKPEPPQPPESKLIQAQEDNPT